MNLDIFKKKDSSGRMSKESFVSKNHSDEYNFIINYSTENNLEELPFKERVYLCINNQLPKKCKNINCDKYPKYINSSLGYRDYCSTKCISSDPVIKDIKTKNSLEKYGTKTPAESQIVKDKASKTNMEKYGGVSPMSCSKTRKKSEHTLMSNYGVSSPNQHPDISKRRIESFKQSDFVKNFKKTSLERQGFDHHWKNPDIRKKTTDFLYKDYRERIEEKLTPDFTFIDFVKDVVTYIKFHCNVCDEDFIIRNDQYYQRTNSGNSICTVCYPIGESSSIAQLEITAFIRENYDGDVIENDRDRISPYEIDIHLPMLNIGFEYNGIFWHSSKFKENDYHLKKWQCAEQNGINITTIWEDDWNTKRDICKSFILNKLNKTKNRIYARKCVIKEVSYINAKSFLDRNHLQGNCISSIRLGLYHDDVLVSMMTFGRLRLPLQKSQKNRDKNKHFELTRFCNLIDHNIIGGASKLLKYFINNIDPISIETYSDNLISDGNLYKMLNFEQKHISKPGYYYFIKGTRQHRFNWRKQKLVEMGYDKNKTELEIMSELGYYRIYNAGNRKWILNKGDIK